jgi:hypothetical protein
MERICSLTPPEQRQGHEARYHIAAGFCEPGDTVIDAACGVGYGARILGAHGDIKYIGVDKDLSVLEEASGPNRTFFEADLEQWETDRTFDIGVGFETIEHLTDYSAYVRWLCKAKRWVIMSCPVVPTVGLNPYHVHDFEPGELPRLFEPEWELYQLFPQPTEFVEVYIMRWSG